MKRVVPPDIGLDSERFIFKLRQAEIQDPLVAAKWAERLAMDSNHSGLKVVAARGGKSTAARVESVATTQQFYLKPYIRGEGFNNDRAAFIREFVALRVLGAIVTKCSLPIIVPEMKLATFDGEPVMLIKWHDGFTDLREHYGLKQQDRKKLARLGFIALPSEMSYSLALSILAGNQDFELQNTSISPASGILAYDFGDAGTMVERISTQGFSAEVNRRLNSAYPITRFYSSYLHGIKEALKFLSRQIDSDWLSEQVNDAVAELQRETNITAEELIHIQFHMLDNTTLQFRDYAHLQEWFGQYFTDRLALLSDYDLPPHAEKENLRSPAGAGAARVRPQSATQHFSRPLATISPRLNKSASGFAHAASDAPRTPTPTGSPLRGGRTLTFDTPVASPLRGRQAQSVSRPAHLANGGSPESTAGRIQFNLFREGPPRFVLDDSPPASPESGAAQGRGYTGDDAPSTPSDDNLGIFRVRRADARGSVKRGAAENNHGRPEPIPFSLEL